MQDLGASSVWQHPLNFLFQSQVLIAENFSRRVLPSLERHQMPGTVLKSPELQKLWIPKEPDITAGILPLSSLATGENKTFVPVT